MAGTSPATRIMGRIATRLGSVVLLLQLREKTFPLDLVEQARVDVIVEPAAVAWELRQDVLGALLGRVEIGRRLRLEVVVGDVDHARRRAMQLLGKRRLGA